MDDYRIFYWMNDTGWFDYDIERNIYSLTPAAPPEARKSFKLWCKEMDKRRKKEREAQNIRTLKSIMFVLICVCVVIYIVVPGIQYLIKRTEENRKTFDVTVEVRSLDRDFYFRDNVMKCEITSINRTDYQNEHVIPNEPKIGDIIYLMELHGDVYSINTSFSLKVKAENQLEAVGEQYEIVLSQSGESSARKPIRSINTDNSDSKIKKYNDLNEADRESATDTIGNFLLDYKDMVPEDQEEEIEAYMEAKYVETGVRVYVVFYDTNDSGYMEKRSNELLESAMTPSILYERNFNDNHWYVRWLVSDDKGEILHAKYEKIGNAYLINGNYTKRIEHVVDTAYEVYDSE